MVQLVSARHRFPCSADEPVVQHGGGGLPREPWIVAFEHERQTFEFPCPPRDEHLTHCPHNVSELMQQHRCMRPAREEPHVTIHVCGEWHEAATENAHAVGAVDTDTAWSAPADGLHSLIVPFFSLTEFKGPSDLVTVTMAGESFEDAVEFERFSRAISDTLQCLFDHVDCDWRSADSTSERHCSRHGRSSPSGDRQRHRLTRTGPWRQPTYPSSTDTCGCSDRSACTCAVTTQMSTVP